MTPLLSDGLEVALTILVIVIAIAVLASIGMYFFVFKQVKKVQDEVFAKKPGRRKSRLDDFIDGMSD